MEKHACPICHRDLTMEHKITHINYHCYPPAVDHHYAKRVVRDNLTQIKVRYRDDSGKKFFFKIDYLTGITEIWSAASGQVIDKEDRVKINQILDTDFTDKDKMIQKLKTYLTFA